MRLLRPLALLTVTMSLAVSACSGFRLSPVTAEPTSKWIPGKFIWHDLITHDVPAVKRFYGGLFGWTFEGEPGNASYTVIRHNGRMIGGIAYSDRKVDGKPVSQWVALMSVEDVDRGAAQFRTRGGRVYVEPRDFFDRGRLAVVADPQGAALGLVRTTGGDPADRDPDPGDWLWNELWCEDKEVEGRFYAALTGYEVDVHRKVAGKPYTVFTRGGVPRAGMLVNPFDDVRSHWISYVRVEDPAAVVAKVEGLGGQVLLKPDPEIRKGTVAIIEDPSGGDLAIQKWPIDDTRAGDDD